MPEAWYVQPNDEIGGWCVMSSDDPPSAGKGRMIATFAAEADARRIAGLHNAGSGGPSATDQQSRTVAEDAVKKWALRYPIPAWGLAEGEQADRLAETWARVVAGMVLDALRAAGRLLPEGGETCTFYEVRWYAGDQIIYWESGLVSRESADERGPQMIGLHDITRYTVHRRQRRLFADGSFFSGPWVAVDQEATDAAD